MENENILPTSEQTEDQIEEQHAPTFPQTQIHVEERGIVLVTHMSAITQFVQIIPAEVMSDLIAKWEETQKTQETHRVNTTKLEIVRPGPSRRPRK